MQLVGLKCWHGCRHIHCSSDHICEGYGPHTNDSMQKVPGGLGPFDDWKASCYFRHFQIIFIFLSLECLPLDVKILANLGPPHIHCNQFTSCCFIVVNKLTCNRESHLQFCAKDECRCWNCCTCCRDWIRIQNPSPQLS